MLNMETFSFVRLKKSSKNKLFEDMPFGIRKSNRRLDYVSSDR
jgi:hypothetical protein